MGRWLNLVVLGWGLAAGCTKRNPAACCTTEADCEAKGLPVGSDCEAGFTCIRNACIAPTMCEASSDCEDDDLPLCNLDTNTCVTCLVDTDCAGGICDPTDNLCRACEADADCASGYCDLASGNCGANAVAWRYLPDACDSPGTVAFDPAAPSLSTIDTTNEVECTRVVPQTDGPDICVLHYTSITIPTTASVRIKGSRVVALVADHGVTIAGTLDVGAESILGVNSVVEGGPGGTHSVSGSYPTPSVQAPDVYQSGGGGAGFKTAGGHGGHLALGGPTTALMNGGSSVDITTIPILIAGPSAESRMTPDLTAQVPGGPGGGGLTVISCAGKITVTGKVNASGGAGTSGTDVRHPTMIGSYKGGGFGGGAGGNVLFQALDIELTGTFLASGGGGGPGATDCGQNPSSCQNPMPTYGYTPTLSMECAPTSYGVGAEPGTGGAGGCGATPPAVGGPRSSTTTSATSGGGGGSVGFFRTATLFNAPVVNPTVAKPAFEPNEQIPRR